MNQNQKPQTKKMDGSQGCKNVGISCDFKGYYLCKYSPEGFCLDCEMKMFPDRFSGCGFCGKAIRGSSYCAGCKGNFCDWLFDLFYNKNENSKSTIQYFASQSDDETNDWKLWSIVQKGINGIVNHYSKNKIPVREFVKPKPYNGASVASQWPGFYTNNGTYVKIDPFELKSKICISDITWVNAKSIMLRELKKNEIDPHNDNGIYIKMV